MKTTVMYTETRTWFFDLDLAQDAGLNETMGALKDTSGFYSYVDDCASDEYESAWHELPQEWRGEGGPDYSEDFRAIAQRELNGEAREIVLSSLVDREQ